MKGPSDRTKVVLRHLPPTITQSMLMEQVDYRFAGRYNLISFRPGKISHKHQLFSRVYIDFKKPEDVIEFGAFFNGHVFVNEKGSQIKAIVEYAPSQRTPKSAKKDGREGTILKDPEYLEFLEFLAKPVENLPSAEIQLERKEAERTGFAKDAFIVTPLMDYVRQKRASKSGSLRSLSNGRASRSRRGISSGSPSSASSKRSSERRKISTTMYVSRDTAKSTSGKDKSTYILFRKQDDEQISDKFTTSLVASGRGAVEQESGVLGTNDVGKKKMLLLKGKEKEISHLSAPSHVENSVISTSVKQNTQRDASGRIIRSILLSKDTRQNQSSSIVQSDQKIQKPNQEKDKRPPRPPNMQLFAKETNGNFDDFIGSDSLRFSSEKQEKRTRNKDKLDRGVWAPLQHSYGSHTNDEYLLSSASQASQSLVDSAEGIHGEKRNEMPSARSMEYKFTGRVVGGHTSFDSGSPKCGGRRGLGKDGDSSSIVSEGKSMKRVGSGYGTNEKQVWVQKSSSGS